jgi:hypothetical protein
MPFIRPEEELKQVLIYHPRKVGKKRGGVIPPAPSVEVVISPTGTTQYENVILSASTTGTSPTFVWTLTDFYDTSDNPITSFTGSVVTEGYFTSHGSSKVSVSVTADEGTGSSSTFVVSEFDALTLSPDIWFDMNDSSTITLRTGTDYIEQVDDKSGNGRDIIQTTASYQPLYSASSVNPTLSAATFDGIDNWMQYNTGTQVSSITGQTTMVIAEAKDKSGLPGIGTGNQLDGDIYNLFGGTSNITNRRHLQRGDGGTAFYHNYYYQTQRKTTAVGSKILSVRRENSTTIDDALVNGVVMNITGTGQARTYNGGSIRIGTMNDLTNNFAQKLYGEMSEIIHFYRTISDDEKDQLNRYLQYKWFGSMTY